MDSPATRLRFLRGRNGIGSAAELARRLGIPEVTYRAHESGVGGFGEPQARRYAEALGANWVWLLTGTGQPFESVPPGGSMPAQNAQPSERGNRSAPAQIDLNDLPVYASTEGGPSGMLVAPEPIDWTFRPKPLQNARDAFAVYVVGSSMEPRYEHGELILLRVATNSAGR